MSRISIAVIFSALIAVSAAWAEECTTLSYGTLVLEAKSADESREWGKSVELYRKILADCQPLLTDADQAKAHDALAVGLLMQGNHSAAVATAIKCVELDAKYNACLMTAAQASYELGDRERAIGFAREAVAIGGYDDYSNAVAIAARSFLRKVGDK